MSHLDLLGLGESPIRYTLIGGLPSQSHRLGTSRASYTEAESQE